MIVKIGHRGACGYEPENTLRSFRRALELKVDMIELDVHVCRTGEVVVIHDETVDRTTDGKGLVREKSLKELRSFNAGRNEKIPLLQEVFDLVKSSAKVNVELKSGGSANPVSDLIETYVRGEKWSYDDFLVSSSLQNELQDVNRLNPNLKTGVLVSKSPDRLLKFAKRINAYSVHPSLRVVGGEFVEKAHREGMKVFVWTVNHPKDIERMKLLRVDGIFSDYPDRLC